MEFWQNTNVQSNDITHIIERQVRTLLCISEQDKAHYKQLLYHNVHINQKKNPVPHIK